MNEPVITVKNVSKNFSMVHERNSTLKAKFTSLVKGKASRTKEVQHALRNISFEVHKGEFFGIVGRNGSGKSTLLKILAEIYQPTKGSVQVKGKLVPFIELGVGFNPELTGKENVYLNGAMLGFSRKEIDAFYDEVVAFAELERFMDKKLKNYSSGMQVRLAFSMAIRANADILLIDEVLAVGDADFQRKCFEYFKKLKTDHKTVVFVSHDMGAVQQYCDRAVLIDDSRIVHIDEAAKVAVMYNKLFINPNTAVKAGKSSASGEERWGDGLAEWTSVKATLVNDKKQVRIVAKGVARQKIEYPILGFSIKDQEFKQLAGTNTTRKAIKVAPMEPGKVFEVVWTVDNIFNSGRHYVDCTIAHDQASFVADRWPDAASFSIRRVEDNPYPVYPNIECHI
jgi:ABC-2 type transport system ATP-binding protein